MFIHCETTSQWIQFHVRGESVGVGTSEVPTPTEGWCNFGSCTTPQWTHDLLLAVSTLHFHLFDIIEKVIIAFLKADNALTNSRGEDRLTADGKRRGQK